MLLRRALLAYLIADCLLALGTFERKLPPTANKMGGEPGEEGRGQLRWCRAPPVRGGRIACPSSAAS